MDSGLARGRHSVFAITTLLVLMLAFAFFGFLISHYSLLLFALPAFSLGLNLVVFIRAHRSPVSASSRFLMVSEGNNCLHSAGPVCFFDSGSAI